MSDKDGPQVREYTDNTGAVVSTIVSDPAVADALRAPSVGQRPPAPPVQLFGPPQNEPADIIPFD